MPLQEVIHFPLLGSKPEGLISSLLQAEIEVIMKVL